MTGLIKLSFRAVRTPDGTSGLQADVESKKLSLSAFADIPKCGSAQPSPALPPLDCCNRHSPCKSCL